MAGRDILRQLFGARPKKPNVARAGSYIAPVDPAGIDTSMRRTLGLPSPSDTVAVSQPVVRPSSDATLDSLARRAGRYRQPYRKPR